MSRKWGSLSVLFAGDSKTNRRGAKTDTDRREEWSTEKENEKLTFTSDSVDVECMSHQFKVKHENEVTDQSKLINSVGNLVSQLVVASKFH